MKIAITGLSSLKDYKVFKKYLNKFRDSQDMAYDEILLIGPKSIDTLARVYAIEYNIDIRIADIEECEYCIIFHNDKPNNVKEYVELCKRHKKPYITYNYLEIEDIDSTEIA